MKGANKPEEAMRELFEVNPPIPLTVESGRKTGTPDGEMGALGI